MGWVISELFVIAPIVSGESFLSESRTTNIPGTREFALAGSEWYKSMGTVGDCAWKEKSVLGQRKEE